MSTLLALRRGLPVLCGVVTGVLTNLVTDGGGWPVILALVAASVTWIAFVIADMSADPTSASVRQVARRGSSISDSVIKVDRAHVRQRATRRGRIVSSRIRARNAASVDQLAASDGEISASHQDVDGSGGNT